MIQQRDPIHPWYPHEKLFPLPIRIAANRILVVSLVAIAIVGTVGVYVAFDYLASGTPRLLVYMAGSLPVILCLLGVRAITESWKRRARRNDYALCLSCGHAIGGLGESGDCPQCQRSFLLEQSKWGWKRICNVATPAIPPGSPEGTPPAGPPVGGMPRPVRNILVIGYGFLVCAALFIDDVINWTLGHVNMPDLFDRIWNMIEGWISIVLVFVVIVAFFNHLRRWRLRAEQLQYHLCLHCGYSLEGAADFGRCPECGTEYTLQGCEIVWRKFCRQQPKLPKDG